MVRHSNPRDKSTVQQWARQLYERPNFYVIDTETSGVGKNDEVVQIGVIDKHGEVVIDTLVKPTKRISQQVIDVHGITNEMLADAPDFFDIYTLLSTKLSGVPLIAYNMSFDWRLLQQTFALRKMPMFNSGKRHCAMKQYAKFYGQRSRNGYRWQKLGMAASQQGITVKDAHTALGDVRMTLALIQRMAEGDV
ncbi:MAG: 3'-5' exonuclease [Chloroflexota bacterium]